MSNYLYFYGTSGTYLSTADRPELSITGALEIWCKVALDDWTPAADMSLLSKWSSGTRSYDFFVNSTGTLGFRWSPDGAAGTVVTTLSSASPSVSNGGVLWVKVEASGTGTYKVDFYTGGTGDVPVWVKLGASQTASGSMAPFDSSAKLVFGGTHDGTSDLFTGEFYEARLFDGLAGPLVWHVDIGLLTTDEAQFGVWYELSPIREFVTLNSGAGAIFVKPEANATPSSVLSRAEGVWRWSDWYRRGLGYLADTSGNNRHAVETNSPVRLFWQGTQALKLPGVAANYASTPDATALDIVGDLDLRCMFRISDSTPAADSALIAKWTTSGNQRSYKLFVDTTSKLGLEWSTDGTSGTVVTALSTANPDYAPGALTDHHIFVRATLDVSSGDVDFYTSPANDQPKWTKLGATVSGSATSIFSSSAILELGSSAVGTADLYQGRIRRAQVYTGIAGTLVFDADFTDKTAVAEPFATFTEGSSNGATVTINRGATGALAAVEDRGMYVLDGSNDYLTVPDDANLDFAADESFTLMFFGRVYDTTPSTIGIPLSKRDSLGSGDVGYSLFINTIGQVGLHISDGSGSVSCRFTGGLTAGEAFVATGVRNVVDDDLTFFMDGVAGTPATDTTTGTLANSVAFNLGADGRPATFFGPGEFFGAALWREALSDADVATAGTELRNLATGKAATFPTFDPAIADVTYSVEVAFANLALYADPVWYELDASIRNMRIRRGRTHILNEFIPGRLTIEFDNVAGHLDPLYRAGKWAPSVQPAKQIRVRAKYNGVTYDLFRGTITGIPNSYPGLLDSVATVTAVDGFDILARTLLSEANVQEFGDVRVHHLLTEANWPGDRRVIRLATGDTTSEYQVQALTPSSGSALTLLRQVTGSDPGQLFIDAAGNVVYEAQQSRYSTASAVTFDATGAQYTSGSTAFDSDKISTKVNISATGLADQSSEASVSTQRFGLRELSKTTLNISTGDMGNVAGAILKTTNEAVPRFDSITIDPKSDPTVLWPQALGRDISDVIQIRRTPAAGNTIDIRSRIEGVEHYVEPGSWMTTWRLS
tara:strand:+ start:379 stop:3546 length:3168 start_codon:yes stop_codon:yes gene_type:complete